MQAPVPLVLELDPGPAVPPPRHFASHAALLVRRRRRPLAPEAGCGRLLAPQPVENGLALGGRGRLLAAQPVQDGLFLPVGGRAAAAAVGDCSRRSRSRMDSPSTAAAAVGDCSRCSRSRMDSPPLEVAAAPVWSAGGEHRLLRRQRHAVLAAQAVEDVGRFFLLALPASSCAMVVALGSAAGCPGCAASSARARLASSAGAQFVCIGQRFWHLLGLPSLLAFLCRRPSLLLGIIVCRTAAVLGCARA